MNRRLFTGLLMVILILTSGPLYLPLVAASYSVTQINADGVKAELVSPNNNELRALVKASSDVASGGSPLLVSFKGTVSNADAHGGVLVYKWDFDGDGVNDYASLDSGDVTHVYLLDDEAEFEAVFTAVFRDGSSGSSSVPLRVGPVDEGEWFEIRRMGFTKFGIRRDGEVVVFDERDWVPIVFKKDGKALSRPVFEVVDNFTRRLSFVDGKGGVDVSFTYGLAGRANFTVVERDAKGLVLDRGEVVVGSKSGVERVGRLDLDVDEAKGRRGGVFRFNAGNHDPWKDTGVVPYGEYFENLNELVSTQTGYLSIVHTDIRVPGRGLDLVIKRVYAPPTTYLNDLPATTADYSYQNYPWAPMGSGWMLGFPWIEWNANGPTYIRLSDGQRYKYENIGYSSKEYHSADHFVLTKHANNTYTLCEVDGKKYRFDSAYKLLYIKDNDGVNTIGFTYQNGKISKITDTIGREYVFTYNADGLLSSISSGGLTWSYEYAITQNVRTLHKVIDPEGRITQYVNQCIYLIRAIIYPSGGQSLYEYKKCTSGEYERYRVSEHFKWDGVSDKQEYTNYVWSANFYEVNSVNIYNKWGNEDKRSIFVSYSQGNILEKVWDGSTLARTENKLLSEDRRRIDVELTPGSLPSYITHSVSRYDEWGNLLYNNDYMGHEVFYSYANTLNSGKFVDSNGAQVHYFLDNFYTFSLSPEIRNRVIGQAEHQNGPGSQTMEEYYKYSSKGNMVESRKLSSGNWITTVYDYDGYGNLLRVTDDNSHVTEYEYDSSYGYAYLTKEKKTLEKQPSNEIITRNYSYYPNTGLMQTLFDEKNNRTDYYYDDVGRLTKIESPEINGKITQRTIEYNDNSLPETYDLGEPTIGLNWKDQTFIADGRIWYFFSLNGVKYCSSADDGVTWSSTTYVDPGDCQIFFDGVYLHVLNIQGNKLYYRRGDPQTDGTINWGNSNFIRTAYSSVSYYSIVVTDSYVWVGYTERDIDREYQRYVIRSTNLNGGWTYYDQPHHVSHETFRLSGKLYALTGDKVCYISDDRSNWLFRATTKIWTGSTWGRSFLLYIRSDTDNWAAVTEGDDVFISHSMNVTKPIQLVKYVYSTNTKTILDSNVYIPTYNCEYSPKLIHGAQPGTVYCVWSEFAYPLYILYRYWNGNELGATKHLITDMSGVFNSDIKIHPEISGNKGYVFYSKKVNEVQSTSLVHLKVDGRAENKVNVYDENNQRVEYIYDGLNRMIQKNRYNSTNLYSMESFEYGWSGLPSTYVDPEENQYQYHYNGLGKATKVVNPDLSEFQTSYDYDTNLVTSIDEEGRKTEFQYDWSERLFLVKEYYGPGLYYQTDYLYDKTGNLVKTIDSLDRETAYSYDQLNRLKQVNNPDGKYEAYTYDGVGNLLSSRDMAGHVTQYTYDSLDRLTGKQHYDGTGATYQYDSSSNLVGSTYNGTQTSRGYDARGRLVRESVNVGGSVYTARYAYDNVSNLIGLSYPDGSSVTYTCDSLNRIKSVSGYASFTYTLSDKVDVVTYSNGVTADYDYDDRGRPTDITVKQGSTVLLDLAYTYDDTGSVTSISDGSTTETYSYDLLDRLTGATGPWDSLSYSYDSVGNRLSLNRGGAVTSYTYDNMNRISSATGMAFTWDDNGNLLTWDDGSDGWAYRYDPEDRLVNVKKNSVASARYTYDADDRRVRSWDAAGTTDYVYSGLSVIDEIRSGVHEKHVYAGGMHLASNSSGTVEYYHVDHLGSTRLKTNSTGGVTYSSNYEPYGPGIGESGSESFRYTGKQEDTTGLYYFGARYYDPVTGRFTTRDSFPGYRSDPQSLNKYIYCRNNPHKYVDPDGKVFILGVIIGTALLGGLTGMEWYVYHTYKAEEQINLGKMLGAFSRGAISGAAGSVVAGAELVGISGVLITSVTSGMADAAGGIVENYISGEEVVPDEVASDIGFGTLTGLLMEPFDVPIEVNTIIGESLSSNKVIIVDEVNEAGDNLIEHIRETYTIPIKKPPIYTYDVRVDYRWI